MSAASALEGKVALASRLCATTSAWEGRSRSAAGRELGGNGAAHREHPRVRSEPGQCSTIHSTVLCCIRLDVGGKCSRRVLPQLSILNFLQTPVRSKFCVERSSKAPTGVLCGSTHL